MGNRIGGEDRCLGEESRCWNVGEVASRRRSRAFIFLVRHGVVVSYRQWRSCAKLVHGCTLERLHRRVVLEGIPTPGNAHCIGHVNLAVQMRILSGYKYQKVNNHTN